jgi:hypothetical protein
MPYVIAAVLAAFVFSLLLSGLVVAIPLAIVVALVGGALVAARSKAAGAGGIERTRRREPTGAPRKSSPDAETANDRVGQR